jgi:hypothetical protein
VSVAEAAGPIEPAKDTNGSDGTDDIEDDETSGRPGDEEHEPATAR